MSQSYRAQQKVLFDQLEQEFKAGTNTSTVVVPVTDYLNDPRICLTSVVFPQAFIQEKIIKAVIAPLSAADPAQYYYHPQAFHITIQNVRTIHNPPIFTAEDAANVSRAFARVIGQFPVFEFTLSGLFVLPTSIALRAYCDETHRDLVLALRKTLVEIGVPDDKTYAAGEVVFGNLTVCRYTGTPNADFFRVVDSLKQIEIGSFPATHVSLITGNASAHPTKTTILGTYELKT